ncbi:copper resistance CopC family protein [Shouchella sp. 1P09AA]|uniref:copper resistance CopC family protein n=1 Tax=unclassified Shouchella TaxID=2893065 RepID=UPI0039A18DC9
MKRILLLTLIVILTVTLNVEFAKAHTAIESSTPSDGAVLEESPNEIEIAFNTAVAEQSIAELISEENGNEIEIRTEVNDDKMLITVPETLQNGVYRVSWKIIGADGHPIEDSIGFTIQNQETSDNESSDEQISNETIEDVIEEDNQTEESSDTSNATIILAFSIVLFLALIAGLILFIKKKRNSP